MSKHAEQQFNQADVAVYEKRVPWITHSIVSVLLLAIAIGIVMKLFGAKPQAGRWGERPAPSVAVDIAPLQLNSYAAWIDSYGTAEALTQTRLVAEVSGRVVKVSDNIRAGGEFKQGDLLVELDPRDFAVEVDIAASAAADAEVVYLQELAQAEFAAQEWNETPTSEAARQLALRKPQVAAAEAALQAAKARLARAELNLERTRIVAPFDGKILAQMIDIGQVVSPSQAIAEIYSTDAVEVRLPVKVNDLEHLQLPPAEAVLAHKPKVILESDMGNRTYQWQGEIVRTEGAFDPATRMLYVVAQVTDPFVDTPDRPAIRVGQFVRARLEGKRYDDVYVIPRRAVSQDFQVSVADNGVLRKRQIQPLWTDSESVVVAANSHSGQHVSAELDLNEEKDLALVASDMLILTPTANLPEGTRVKPLGQPSQSEQTEPKRPTLTASQPTAENTGAADTVDTDSSVEQSQTGGSPTAIVSRAN